MQGDSMQKSRQESELSWIGSGMAQPHNKHEQNNSRKKKDLEKKEDLRVYVKDNGDAKLAKELVGLWCIQWIVLQ